MTTENKDAKAGEPRLYAGKYKTVEDLEEGYKKSYPLYQENETLKKKLEEVTKTPDDYLTPSEAPLSAEELSELKAIAKNSGLTQNHFDKLVFDKHEKNKARVAKLEETKKSLGVEKLNIINDYVTKHYPEEIGTVIVDRILEDKKLMDAALRHRETILNSSVPGTNRITAPEYLITKADVMKAAQEIEKAPYHERPELEKKYINIAKEFRRQKDAKKQLNN
jgi:hypothetical protein